MRAARGSAPALPAILACMTMPRLAATVPRRLLPLPCPPNMHHTLQCWSVRTNTNPSACATPACRCSSSPSRPRTAPRGRALRVRKLAAWPSSRRGAGQCGVLTQACRLPARPRSHQGDGAGAACSAGARFRQPAVHSRPLCTLRHGCAVWGGTRVAAAAAAGARGVGMLHARDYHCRLPLPHSFAALPPHYPPLQPQTATARSPRKSLPRSITSCLWIPRRSASTRCGAGGAVRTGLAGVAADAQQTRCPCTPCIPPAAELLGCPITHHHPFGSDFQAPRRERARRRGLRGLGVACVSHGHGGHRGAVPHARALCG